MRVGLHASFNVGLNTYVYFKTSVTAYSVNIITLNQGIFLTVRVAAPFSKSRKMNFNA